MPLYSASKLIGQTLVMNGLTNYYRVFDLNSLGDKAKPAGQLKKGTSIQVDSFLLPVDAHTDPTYGIKYAQRSDTYITYMNSSQNYAIKLSDIGKQSNVLTQQGVETVKQEVEQQKNDNSLFGNLFGNLGGTVKTILILIIVIIIIVYTLPLLSKMKK